MFYNSNLHLRMKLNKVSRLVVDAHDLTWPDEWKGPLLGLRPALDDIARGVEELKHKIKDFKGQVPSAARDAPTKWGGWTLKVDLDRIHENTRNEVAARVLEFCSWIDKNRVIDFMGSWVGGISVPGEEVFKSVRQVLLDFKTGPSAGQGPGARPPHGPTLPEHERMFLFHASLNWPCSVSELKVAFKRLALQTHPDRDPSNPQATNKFRLLKDGYESLCKRAHN